ncbi:Nonribosomal peptide synthetase 12 [Apiospora sp. TS-2023a]
MPEIPRYILEEIAKSCSVAVDAVQDVYGCTPLQIGIMAQLDQRTYNHTFIFTLKQDVVKKRFSDAFCQVVAKNSVLRTRIVSCELGLMQVVIAEEFQVTRQSYGLASFLKDLDELQMHFNNRLLQVAIVEDKLVLRAHHALVDSVSVHTMISEVSRAYHGEPTEDHADFKLFYEHCCSIDDDFAKSFWRAKFDGQPGIFPTLSKGYTPEASKQISKEINHKAAIYKVEFFLLPSYIQVAWGLTVASYVKSENVTYGLVFSGRAAALGITSTTLGPTIATVPVQMKLKSTSTIGELVKSCNLDRRETQTSPALQYGLLNIRQVSEDAAAASRFTTLLNILAHESMLYERDLQYEYEFESRSPYCLGLVCNLNAKSISVQATFDEGIIPRQQMCRVLNQFEHILQLLIRHPNDTTVCKLPLVSVQDRREILEWNRMVPDVPQKCLHDIIKDQILHRPDQVAVSAYDGSLTFAELDLLSSALAQRLYRWGISTEMPVALMFEKSRWTIISHLGVLKAGGVCVPIDPGYPTAQKLAIISSSNAGVLLASTYQQQEKSFDCLSIDTLIVNKRLLSEGLSTLSTELPYPSVAPSQAAYILFTSGSTGAPKGVVLEHRNLVSALTAFGHRIGWTSGTRVLQFASSVWGASIIETLGTLIAGGCVCVPSDESRASNLVDYVAMAGVECAILTPTVIRMFSPADMPCLKSLCSAGEALDIESARTWSAGGVRFFNGWGQSETSVCSTLAELTFATPYHNSIGTPVGCAIWIADDSDINKLVPIGAAGQLVIEGPGVARGYLNDEAKTTASFVPPQSWTPKRYAGSVAPQDRRLYRSGDLARYNADGSVEYIGRQSSQVKISGQRFDLGEVEKAICSNAAVRGAFATVHTGPDGQKDLVAVLTLSNPHFPRGIELEELVIKDETLVGQDLRRVRDYLVSHLPSYMVPTVWLTIQDLPRTASSKLDRNRLREWIGKRDLVAARISLSSLLRGRLTPPATAKEKVLHSSWAAVLTIPGGEIGRESSLLSLGGDSVTAMRIVSLCRRSHLLVSVAALLRSETLIAAAAAGEWLPLCSATDAKLSDPSDYAQEAVEPYESSLIVDGKDLARSGNSSLAALSNHLTTMDVPISNVQAVLPCTSMQDGILFAQMGGSGDEYWNTMRMRMSTDDTEDGVDPEQVIRAWRSICSAQPVLRTFFISSVSESESAFQQVILKQISPSVSQGPMRSHKQPAADFPKPDLSQPEPPHHLFLTRVSRYVVYVTIYINHALMDDRSMGILGQQLRQAYTDPSGVAPGPDLSKYVAWDRNHRVSASHYWKDYLAGASPCLIPSSASSDNEVSFPKAKIDSHFHDAIPTTDASIFHDFCRRHRITIANLVQVAWSFVLAKCTNKDQVCFGSILSQQSAVERGDVTLGPLLAMVVCRFEITQNTTVSDLLELARENALSVLEHGGCPMSEMNDELSLGQSPLFNTAITIARTHPRGAQDELKIRLAYLDIEDNPTEYPLTVGVGYDQNSFAARIWCNGAKISPLYASELGAMFSSVLDRIMHDPGQMAQLLASHMSSPSPVDTRVEVAAKQITPSGSVMKVTSQDTHSNTHSTPSHGTTAFSDTETQLRQLWSQVLSLPLDTIEKTDSFFDMGGNSIRAMRLVNKGREAGFAFTVADVFKTPTLSRLASVLALAQNAVVAPGPEPKPKTSSGAAVVGLWRTRQLAAQHPCFRSENLESVIQVTDTQAFILATSELDGVSLHNKAITKFAAGLDSIRLVRACEHVVRHHSLLRTVFVQDGACINQVVLKSLPTSTVSINSGAIKLMGFDEARYLPKFHLRSSVISGNPRLCYELSLTIHHALYDAISMALILEDLRAAYTGAPLSDSPKFCDWVSHVNSTDSLPSYAYWRQLLNNSTVTSTVPPALPIRGLSCTSRRVFRTSSRHLQTRYGLPPSVLNAAWAVTLSLMTGSSDLVFGAVNANRSMAFDNVSQVPGPCLNFLPVRATLADRDTFGTLVHRLQCQAISGIPHQQIGFRTIVKECTEWPSWTRLSSVLVYQNHGSVGESFSFGDVDATFAGEGTIGDSTDFWIIAQPAASPGDKDLELEVLYSRHRVSDEQAQWVCHCLETIMASCSILLESPLQSFELLLGVSTPRQMSSATSIVDGENASMDSGNPSAQATAVVAKAWKEIGLPSQARQEHNDRGSLFNNGGDLVTVVALSWWFKYRGYDVSMYDIIENPTKLGQSKLLDGLLRMDQ